jgi:hypothetical protein
MKKHHAKQHPAGSHQKAKGSFFKYNSFGIKKYSDAVRRMPKGELVLIVWILFSIMYVAQDVYKDLRSLPVETAYTKGKTEVINSVVSSAQKCQPFNVASQAGTAQLINVACIKAAAPQQQQQQAQQAEPAKEE